MILVTIYIVIAIIAFILTVGSSYFEYEEIRSVDIEEGILVGMFWFPIIMFYITIFIIDIIKRK